jgi:hypothetical protein
MYELTFYLPQASNVYDYTSLRTYFLVEENASYIQHTYKIATEKTSINVNAMELNTLARLSPGVCRRREPWYQSEVTMWT